MIAVIVKAGWTHSIDTRCILALRAAAPGLESPMRVVSFLAAQAAAPLAILIALAIGRVRRARQAWMYVFACLAGWMLNLVLKELLRVVRPNGVSPKLTDAGWWSFPSGHTMMAALIFGFGAVLLAAPLRSRGARFAVIGAGVALSFVVGLSRIYLGRTGPATWSLAGAPGRRGR